MDRDDERADRSREVACKPLRLARPLLDGAGDRIAAAKIALLIGRLEVEPQARDARHEDMWEIMIPHRAGADD